MGKLTVVINGVGGVGKDTLVDAASKHFSIGNVSAITPIKDIAHKYGGWNGEKDAKSRKFLAELKELFVNYNDLPFQYLCDEYKKFVESDKDVLFVHIREDYNIDKMKNHVVGEGGSCVTLLVERAGVSDVSLGNKADDNVRNYTYDYTYHNDKPLDHAESDFCTFLRNVLQEKEASEQCSPSGHCPLCEAQHSEMLLSAGEEMESR